MMNFRRIYCLALDIIFHKSWKEINCPSGGENHAMMTEKTKKMKDNLYYLYIARHHEILIRIPILFWGKTEVCPIFLNRWSNWGRVSIWPFTYGYKISLHLCFSIEFCVKPSPNLQELCNLFLPSIYWIRY